MDIRKFAIRSACALITLFGLNSGLAQEPKFSEITLAMTEFATSFCGELSLEGSAFASEKSGQVEGDLTFLNKLLGAVGFGVEAQANTTDEKSFNVLREQLAGELINNRDCRLAVLDKLSRPLAAAGFGPTDSAHSATITMDLPAEVSITKLRSTKILDGEVELKLTGIQVYGEKNKNVSFTIDRSGRGVRSFIFNYTKPPIVEFEFRQKMYELELKSVNVADQIVTLKLLKQQ